MSSSLRLIPNVSENNNNSLPSAGLGAVNVTDDVDSLVTTNPKQAVIAIFLALPDVVLD